MREARLLLWDVESGHGQDIREEQRERRRNGERAVCEEYEEGVEQE